MCKIRFGKRIKFIWTLLLNGEVINLSDHAVEVEITLPNNNTVIAKPEVNENVITFYYQGHSIGKHYITCYVDRRTENETMIDEPVPFILVDKTWKECPEFPANNLKTETLDLQGTLDISGD